MRIALFSDTYLPQKNGVAVAVNQLKHELTKLGHDVFVYTIEIPSSGEIEEQVMRSRAILVPKLGADENLIAFPSRKKTLAKLKEDAIDIIHTHTELPQGFLGRNCARALGIPHIHTVHTMWCDYRHYLFRGRLLTERNVAMVYHIFLRKSTAVIAPSLKAVNFLSQLNIPSVQIHNGVDSEPFFAGEDLQLQEHLRKELNITPSNKVIIFVGRIAPEKRAGELCALICRLMQQNQDVKAVFIGDGVDAEELKERVAELDLTDRFYFAGRVEHKVMVNYYAIAHLYLTISLSEVQPMTLIEALLSGLPIIAREDLAYQGLIDHGFNGFLGSSDEDVYQLALDLLQNHEQLLAFSKASKEMATHFTAHNNAIKTLALYEQAIERGRPSSFQRGPLVYDTE